MSDVAPGVPSGSPTGPGVAEELPRDQISLARRLRDPRTVISIALPIVVIALVLRNLPGFHLDDLVGLVLAADPLLLLAGFAIYYAGFPLRGYRWALLLRRAGMSVRVRDATEIVFISWLVNCLVPAKLGDVYRAWLLRLNYAASLSRTFGTVFIERVFDLFAIAVLGLGAGFWSFRSGLEPAVQFVLGLGVAVVVILAVGLFTLRNFGRRLIARLPLPHKVADLYERFEEGVFALPAREVPVLGALTVVVWMTEAFRLFFVIAALGFDDLHLGLSGTMFVALAASLLTAVPFTPGGLGIVEAGIVGILNGIYGVPLTEATAIALLDRAISVLSIIVLGGIAYTLSSKTRGMRTPAPGEGAAGG